CNACPLDLRDTAWRYYERACRRWQLDCLVAHTRRVSAVTFSPDGKTLASASDDTTVKLWDVATGTQRVTLRGHSKEVLGVAFSPDGRTLASGSHDGTVKTWDAATGTERSTLKVPTGWVSCVCFSPDGKTLAAGSGGYDAQSKPLPGEI